MECLRTEERREENERGGSRRTGERRAEEERGG